MNYHTLNFKNIILTALLLATLSLSSTMALKAAKKMTVAPESNNNANNPDFFMLNASYKQFDKNGKIRNHIYSSKISHFAKTNSFVFDNPHMKMYSDNENPWDITANKGKSEHGKAKIYLWDNVKIMQIAGKNNADFNVATTSLTVYPDKKLAETDKAVTIIQGGNIARATGAQADFKSGMIKLLSKVQGQYNS